MVPSENLIAQLGQGVISTMSSAPVVGDYFAGHSDPWRNVNCGVWCIILLSSTGLVYLLHILQFSIELGAWADGNITLLWYTTIISFLVLNGVFMVLSPKEYWKEGAFFRYINFGTACFLLLAYLVSLIDLIVLVVKGHSIGGDIFSMVTGYTTYFQTQGVFYCHSELSRRADLRRSLEARVSLK